MRFLFIYYFLIAFFVSTNIFSQENNIIPYSKKVSNDTISYWIKQNKVGFDFTQIAFVNWNAGGASSISGLAKANFVRTYCRKNYKWENELIVRYGLNKQEGKELQKTDDVLLFNSTFGYRKDTLTNWYYSSKFNFNTQFTNGYAYPNTSISISKPFAPAYLFLGIGAENINKRKNYTIYISPFTFKNTLVLDSRLANQGAFGVRGAQFDANGTMIISGEKSKVELGMLFSSQLKKEVYKNIILDSRLILYSDYINKFGNIDVDWNILFELVVNKYVKANIGTHLIYDDDIKAKDEVNGKQITIGPKIQLKQLLGIGVVYEF